MSLPVEYYMSGDVPKVACHSLFRKYDKDGSDSLCHTELTELLHTDLGLTEAQASCFIAIVDTDNSGTVCFPEFWSHVESGSLALDCVKDKNRLFLVQQALQLFRTIDKDKSGFLEGAELDTLCSSLGLANADRSSLLAIDQDNDGKISFPEFMKWLNWVQL